MVHKCLISSKNRKISLKLVQPVTLKSLSFYKEGIQGEHPKNRFQAITIDLRKTPLSCIFSCFISTFSLCGLFSFPPSLSFSFPFSLILTADHISQVEAECSMASSPLCFFLLLLVPQPSNSLRCYTDIRATKVTSCIQPVRIYFMTYKYKEH